MNGYIQQKTLHYHIIAYSIIYTFVNSQLDSIQRVANIILVKNTCKTVD